MIFYNFKKVLRESKYSGHELINIIKYLAYKPQDNPMFSWLPEAEYSYRLIDWTGQNFLVNPKELIRGRKYHPDKDIVEYIGLSSLRNYSEYLISKDTSLDLLACPRTEDQIDNNSLLLLDKGRIRFLYEEAKNKGATKWQ